MRYSPAVTVLIYYVGLGYVVLLAWAAILFDAVRSEPPASTRVAATVLRFLGLLHPAAAIGAWDIRRELARDRHTLQVPGVAFPVDVVVSCAIAGAVVVTSV